MNFNPTSRAIHNIIVLGWTMPQPICCHTIACCVQDVMMSHIDTFIFGLYLLVLLFITVVIDLQLTRLLGVQSTSMSARLGFFLL